jgi:hypothetical protein
MKSRARNVKKSRLKVTVVKEQRSPEIAARLPELDGLKKTPVAQVYRLEHC